MRAPIPSPRSRVFLTCLIAAARQEIEAGHTPLDAWAIARDRIARRAAGEAAEAARAGRPCEAM